MGRRHVGMEGYWAERIAEIWEISRANWHYPLLPRPVLGEEGPRGFPFENYRITVSPEMMEMGDLYLENVFDHLIVRYIFCPRSLETAGRLALATLRSLERPTPKAAKRMVNVFSEIVSDSFRLERSPVDEALVLLGWRRLGRRDLSSLDAVVLGFLGEFWGIDLLDVDRPEVELLVEVFSAGIRDKALWERQCGQMARILEPLDQGVLGRGEVRALAILRGNAEAHPFSSLAAELEPEEFREALLSIGLKADLRRWYRDQGYAIEIKSSRQVRESLYPSSPTRWRLSDPPSELDIPYSLSMSPRLIPGITTYRREEECGQMVPGRGKVPSLLVVLDSSRSMDGHRRGSKTHSATLSAFKASEFAHSEGAEIAAINFSESYIAQSWTRDLSAIEEVLVEYIGSRTHIPGREILRLARQKQGCLILCITDTQIQNLYNEWEQIEKAAKCGQFVLFCIDQERRDRNVEEALKGLGTVYYIDRPEDLLSLVVETAERAYRSGESFISLE